MEKICIVKLRNKIDDPMLMGKCGQEHLVRESGMLKGLSSTMAGSNDRPEMDNGNVSSAIDKDGAGDRTVSLPLNRQQMLALRSNPHMASFIHTGSTEKLEAMNGRDETMVIKFVFESIPPVRLLKVGEVLQMLRISKGYLKKLVNQGKLKSYKLGRLRRFMLEDILSYLEESRASIGQWQQVSTSGISYNGMA